MTMAIYSETKSDKWIKEKMVKHRSTHGAQDRKLIRQKLDNGYLDGGSTHAIYYLHGSGIKSWAVRKGPSIHFYDGSGKRWATYHISGRPAIKHEISTRNQKLLEEFEEEVEE